MLLLMNLLATEHTHNIPHDTTKAYTECEASTSLEYATYAWRLSLWM